MKPPEIIQKLYPFILLVLVLGVALATNREAEANSLPPNIAGFNASSQVSPLPTSVIPTQEPTSSPTDVPSSPTPVPTPSTEAVSLVFDGPSSVGSNETFNVSVIAQNVPAPGLYGVQFEIHYDPQMLAASNLQINPNLQFIVFDDIDNTAGMIKFVASQQGHTPGLTGDVTLLSFQMTTTGKAGMVTLHFEDQKFSDFTAQGFKIIIEDHEIMIDQDATPVPTQEPTPQPTDPPVEPTPEPTDEPTPGPTIEPSPPPTTEPTPRPTVQPTVEPGVAEVTGQIILAGRAGNNWSGATAKVNSGGQTGTSEANGNFNIVDVALGLHTITANAPGFLSAVCSDVDVTAPKMALAPVTLVSGDINDDDKVDIVDATAVGTSFGLTGPDLPVDITRDEIVDIFDIVLVSVNYGEAGPQNWNCTAPNSSPVR